MAKGNSTTLTETSMRASGLMTGLMGTGYTRILKGTLMQGNGSMTFKMVKAKKPGWTDQHSKVHI